MISARLMAAICLLLSGCASPQWREVMAHREIQGKYQEGACRLYVKELQGKLSFPTTRIAWTATGIDPFAKSVRHEVLAYHRGQEIWFVDNFNHPKWVGMDGERVEVMAMQFYAPNWVIVSDIVVQ